MTRNSKLALVTVLVGLLSFTSVATVSADNYCDAGAYSDCVQGAASDDAALFHIETVQSPIHILSANGIGQENYEAMDTARFMTFTVAAPTHILSANGMGQEHYEAMDIARFSTNEITVRLPHLSGYATEHYEQMLATGASN